ncbi:MAG: S8 family peptidase [Actinomycetota bacterium]|nr:S8 family peptidase [Actinomycetota bacterium]
MALVDTGINPYHEVFRDRSRLAQRHPSTYIPGFPKDAKALRLTLNAPDYWTAVKADCKRIWSKIKPGQLYWFPGTKIVGGIAFDGRGLMNCDAAEPSAGGRILDNSGHGTMVASRAAATEYGACKKCRVVAVQMPTSVNILNPGPSTDSSIRAITWAAKNASWIDAQSNSWGPIVPLWDPSGQAGLLAANPELARAVERVSRRHLAFWASGNGVAFRGGVLGHPTLLSPHLGPSAVIVGGHDSGYMNTWPGFSPHVVSDSCASWAAHEDEIDKSGDSVGGGTSGATPFAAGGAGRILLEARRLLRDDQTGVSKRIVAQGRARGITRGPLKDGKFTLAEWRQVLFKTASERPKRQFEDGPVCEGPRWGPTPVKWADVPDAYPEYVQIGYGAVDGDSAPIAARVLAGLKPLPDRSETDQYFAADRAAREVLHQIFTRP